MFECVDNGHYSYPASHLILPSIVFLLYGNGKWNSLWFSLALACIFELVEYISFEIFDGYITFPDVSDSLEAACDIVLLDIGNALLGCILSWITLHSTNTITVRNLKVRDIVLVVIIFIAYSISSSVGWYCNKWFYSDCEIGELVSFPYGNLVCVLLLSILCFCVIRVRSSSKLAWFIFLNVCVVSFVSSLLVLSSAILTYIAFGILCILYGVVNLYDKKVRYVALGSVEP